MKIAEAKKNLREKSVAELKKALDLEYGKLIQTRVDLAIRKEKDYTKIDCTKKQIARILTIISEKLEEPSQP